LSDASNFFGGPACPTQKTSGYDIGWGGNLPLGFRTGQQQGQVQAWTFGGFAGRLGFPPSLTIFPMGFLVATKQSAVGDL